MGKKILAMLFSILAATFCVLTLSACQTTHEHDYTVTVVQPTCIENGYTLHVCDCGKSYRTDEVSVGPHDLQFMDAAEATCSENGYTAYYECTVCKKWFTGEDGVTEITDKESILTAKIPHTLTYFPEMPALCSYKGHIGYYECSVCNKLFSDEDGKDEIVDSKSVEIDFDDSKHLWGDWHIVKDPTCTASGQEMRVCEYDQKHVQTRNASKLKHNLNKVEEVKATCTKNGQREYYECSVCKKWFSDSNGQVSTDKQSIVIPSNGSEHTFGAWQTVVAATCFTEGTERRFCIYNQEHTETRVVAALEHNISSIEEVKPTCTKEGHIEFYECSLCQKLYFDVNGQNEITDWNVIKLERLPHELTHIPEKASTCTEKGNVEYYECLTCNTWFFDGNGQIEIIDQKRVITDLLPHILVNVPEKSSTCTENGNIGYYECSVCKKWFTDDSGRTEIEDKNLVITDLLPHEYVDGICRMCNTLYSTDGLQYSEVYENNKLIGYELSGIGTATDTDIIVAKEYDGLPVIGVGISAFHKNTQITSVTLQSGILKIGKYAFQECTGLKNIVIPEGVISIGSLAFRGSGLTGNLVIPDSVTEFGFTAFMDCVGITEITLGSGVRDFNDNLDISGSELFMGCTGLTKVTLKGANATMIPDGAFAKCTNLREVIISAKVKGFGIGAFVNCENINDVYYSGTIDQWANIYFEIDRSNPLYYAENFYVNNQLVTEAVISSDKVDDYAFCNYDKLTSVTLLDTVIAIGESAFRGCTGLAGVTLSNELDVISYFAFSGCSLLKAITIPESLTVIGSYAFLDCVALESIVIPDSVTHMSNGVFQNCTNLTFAKIGKGVDKIGEGAFLSCSKLENLTLSVGLKEIGASAFRHTALKEIIIPDGVTYLGRLAFEQCKELNSITLPNAVINIADNVFTGTAYFNDRNNWENDVLLYIDNHLIRAENLTGNYQIKEGTLTIAGNAFIDCTNLTGVTIPESVKALGDSAFKDCAWLKEIVIPSGVTIIGGYAFYGCAMLSNVVIPDGVTSIEYHTFENCKALESVTIPDSVTSIDYEAFANCSSLKSIRLPDGITYLAMNAFSGCTGLTSIVIPNGIKRIGQSSFYGCTGLKSVVIPKGVKSIDYGAFNKCENLEAVYFLGSEAEWQAITVQPENDALKTATVYYYSETEPTTSEDGSTYSGNYWHFGSDGITPVIWKKQ